MNILIRILLWTLYLLSLYFSVFFVLVLLDIRRDIKKGKGSEMDITEFPMISIIIPAYNEEKTIMGTIKSCLNLDYPKNKVEIIVVNDGSIDNTEKIVKEYIKDKKQVKLISHKNIGKGASLNKALKIIKGKYFACLDADSFVGMYTLKKMLRMYERDKLEHLAIVTPTMKIRNPKNILQKLQWFEYLISILVGRMSSRLDIQYVAPGPFSLYRTKTIKQLGGFDEKTIVEDQEIAYKVQKHNYIIKQCPTGYVYTVGPDTLKKYYYQRKRWYKGAIGCLVKYKEIIGNKKYGDFGVFQLVKNIASMFIVVGSLFFVFYFTIIPLFQKIYHLFMIRFDILPYLLDLTWKFDILKLDIQKIFIVVCLLSITMLLFYYSHRNAKERIRKHGAINLVPYIFFYYILKGAIFLMAMSEFVFLKKKKQKWRSDLFKNGTD